MLSTHGDCIAPLRASLGPKRQGLLASPSGREVNPVGLAVSLHNLDFTLPSEGRVAKLDPQGRSAAREGVFFPTHQMAEKY